LIKNNSGGAGMLDDSGGGDKATEREAGDEMRREACTLSKRRKQDAAFHFIFY
jgi:hypothetical protein